MRDKLVLKLDAAGKRVFEFADSRNKFLSDKVAKTLTYGMIAGKTDAELVSEIWDDDSLSNEEVASLVYALPTAVEKLNSIGGKLGLGKQVKTVKTIDLNGGDKA